eukprot:gene18750-biopygen17441
MAGRSVRYGAAPPGRAPWPFHCWRASCWMGTYSWSPSRGPPGPPRRRRGREPLRAAAARDLPQSLCNHRKRGFACADQRSYYWQWYYLNYVSLRSANCTVERNHLNQWYARTYTQAHGHVMLSIQLSSQKIDSCL